jgi:hypothetical protein
LVKQEVLEYSRVGCTREEIFGSLESLPRELEGFYSRILDELETRKERDVMDGLRILRFVLFTHRPLRLEELRHALAIPHEIDAEFPCSDESFEERLIEGIGKRVIQCAGNFLDIIKAYGNILPPTITIVSSENFGLYIHR